MLVGTGIAAILAPAILGPMIVEQGWRTGALAMAVVTLAVGLPVSLLLKEGHRNADALPNGAPHSGSKRQRGRFERNGATITLVAVAFTLGLIVAGLIVHFVPMLVDRRMDPKNAAALASAIGMAVIGSRVVVGYLFDRLNAPLVAALFLLSPVIACLLLWLDGPVLPAAIMLGIAAGVEVDMLAFFTGRFARMSNYGATYGVMLGVFSLGASLGPLTFGWSVDWSGGYDAALVVSALFLTMVVLLVGSLAFHKRADGETA